MNGVYRFFLRIPNACVNMVVQNKRSYKLRFLSASVIIILLAILVFILRGLSKLHVVYNFYDPDMTWTKSVNSKHIIKVTETLVEPTMANKSRLAYALTIQKEKMIGKKDTRFKHRLKMGVTKRSTRDDLRRFVELGNYTADSRYINVETGEKLNEKENAVFTARRKHLLHYCQKYDVVHLKRKKTNVFNLHKPTNILYCPVAKVATRFFSMLLFNVQLYKTVQRTYAHILPQSAEHGVKTDYTYDVINKFRDGATAVLFVRDPYTRLFSAYIDKFFSPGKYYLNIGSRLLSFIRENPGNACGHDVTFAEFIHYVIKTSGLDSIDRHYKPISATCEPCNIKFNIIGKLETFEEDINSILKIVDAQNISDVIREMHNESEGRFLQLNAKNLLQGQSKILECMSRREMLVRFWRKKQITGALNRTATLPNRNYTNMEFVETVLEAHRHAGPKEIRHINRLEAMTEAYSTVTERDIQKIKEIYKLDFVLFNYNDSPEFLAKSRNYIRNFSYFNLDM